jgi:hypothetical protein
VEINTINASDSKLSVALTSDAPMLDANHWNYAGQKMISTRLINAVAALV